MTTFKHTGIHDFTGATPSVPTEAPGTSTTQAASTAFVAQAIAALSGTYAQKSATWATGVDYVVDELVINSGTSASTTAHTSGASFDAGNFTAIAT